MINGSYKTVESYTMNREGVFMRQKISFEGVDPKKGQVIVAKAEKPVSVDELIYARNILQEAFPNNKVVVLQSNMNLHYLTKESFVEFIENMKSYVKFDRS